VGLVFIDQVKQVGFKASVKCGEEKGAFDCVWEVIATEDGSQLVHKFVISFPRVGAKVWVRV